MISVAQALEQVLALVEPLESETVPLLGAAGRVLARDVEAKRAQPPFDASAMDGYAIRFADLTTGAVLNVVGESAAGSRYKARVETGQAVRIFTGAPVPEGADHVIIQENVTRAGDRITVNDLGNGANIRPAGGDFSIGDKLSAPRRLSASDVALLASMNIAEVPVARRPVVALIATGDELVQPGETPGEDQIIASNNYGLHALLSASGAEVRMLPIAPDDLDAITHYFEMASDADLVVSIGGASVGDHDLIVPAMDRLGIERAFYKVAMRPGKPLIAGRYGKAVMIGLPGNPVSAMVCATIYLRPALDAMQGLPGRFPPATRATLAAPLPANGPRTHFMRGYNDGSAVTPAPSQDSSLLGLLANANCLIVRTPDDQARTVGEIVEVIPL